MEREWVRKYKIVYETLKVTKALVMSRLVNVLCRWSAVKRSHVCLWCVCYCCRRYQSCQHWEHQYSQGERERERENEQYERDSAKHATTTTQAKQQRYILPSLKNTNPPAATLPTTISASTPLHSTLIFTIQIIILVSLVVCIPSLFFPSIYLPLFLYFATPLISSLAVYLLSTFRQCSHIVRSVQRKRTKKTFRSDVI